jgi:hypothetical protein
MTASYGAEFWDQRYGTADGFVFGTAPNDFLRAVADRIPPGPVLCLAEGEGRNAVFLAGRGHASRPSTNPRRDWPRRASSPRSAA